MNAPIRDAEQIVGVSQLKAYAQETSSTTGTAVDLGAALYQGAVFVADLGANGNPTGDTHAMVIQGSNDDSTYETVATFATWDVNTATGLYVIGFDSGKGPKRYYKYASTQSATADVTYSLYVVGIKPSQVPVTQV